MFCYFLEFSITIWVGTHRNDFFLFLFFFPLFLGLRQLILAWKEATMVFFNFFEFFCYFFWIFYYGLGRNSLERFFFVFFFPLFLGLPLLILAWKEATMVFFNFFEYFCFFFLIFYYGPGRNLLERFFFYFYFLSFSAISNLFWPEEKP